MEERDCYAEEKGGGPLSGSDAQGYQSLCTEKEEMKDQDQDQGQGRPADIAPIRIKLGLIVPSNEYNAHNIEMIRHNVISKRSVTFCAEQFKNDRFPYEIVDVCVVTEAAASLFDIVITEEAQLDERVLARNSICIVLDIGAGKSEFAAIQGIDIIPSSEKIFFIGVNDCLREIARQAEQKFTLEEGCLDLGYVDSIIRYPVAFCQSCGNIYKTEGPCGCGDEARLKKNILRLGGQAVDISDIAEAVYDEKADALAEFCKRYLDGLFRFRGMNKAQLDTIVLTGGGAEIFGQRLKERIQKYAGEFVRITKAGRATWTALNGLGKYALYKDHHNPKTFDKYIFVDPGNANTKAKCVGVGGQEFVKPVLMQTKIATPLKQPSFSLKKVNPMLDLDIKISSEDGRENKGDGHFFVSYLANRGKDTQIRDLIIPKTSDDLIYTMIHTAIGVMLARNKAARK